MIEKGLILTGSEAEAYRMPIAKLGSAPSGELPSMRDPRASQEGGHPGHHPSLFPLIAELLVNPFGLRSGLLIHYLLKFLKGDHGLRSR